MGQSFISDSVEYKYVGSMSAEDGERLLRQMGRINHATTRPDYFPSEIIRDGDLITIITPQGPILESNIPDDFEPWRYSIVSIMIQNRTALKSGNLIDGSKTLEQTFVGYAEMGVYNSETEALIPSKSFDSPYVNIIWQLIDSNKDGKHEQLRFHMITSRDICETIYCHPK
jgi:hypothetical protein